MTNRTRPADRCWYCGGYLKNGAFHPQCFREGLEQYTKNIVSPDLPEPDPESAILRDLAEIERDCRILRIADRVTLIGVSFVLLVLIGNVIRWWVTR